jgi:hypothetical protein
MRVLPDACRLPVYRFFQDASLSKKAFLLNLSRGRGWDFRGEPLTGAQARSVFNPHNTWNALFWGAFRFVEARLFLRGRTGRVGSSAVLLA